MKKLTLLLILIMTGCGGDPQPVNTRPTASTDSYQKTPLGAVVYSKHGVTLENLKEVDRGLTKTFENAAAYPVAMRTANFYKIYIPVEDCTLRGGIYNFKIEAPNYDGSVYDQHNTMGELPEDQRDEFNWFVKDGIGRIYAPEWVMNPAKGEMMICREALEIGAQYGSEHILIFHSDYAYYNETKTHDKRAHPLLPK